MAKPKDAGSREASLPDAATLMAVDKVDPPHPATLSSDQLLNQCQLRTQRRGGPGGQHRNKTSSGVFLEHEPTGHIGEATERRSQAQNRTVALARLRHKLAIVVRTSSPLNQTQRRLIGEEARVRDQYRRSKLRLADSNADRPAVLAMLLDDLWAAGGQPSLVAKAWDVSTSSINRFLRSQPAAMEWVNRVREHHQRPPLK